MTGRSLKDIMLTAVSKAVRDGSGEVALSGSAIRITTDRVERGRMRVEVADGPGAGFHIESFPASPERPAGYPADLPFVAGEAVSICGESGATRMFWWSASDPETVCESLVVQSEAAGWERTGSEELMIGQDVHVHHLERDGSRRMVIAASTSGGMVSLLDR